jgi:two-component system, NtrC family, nitrogen regulation sensor histidine kinase NtrY
VKLLLHIVSIIALAFPALLSAGTHVEADLGADFDAANVQNLVIITGAGIVVFVIGLAIIRRLFRLHVANKHGYAGAQLQSRVVKTFTLVTIIPTIIISIFSIFFFYFVIQDWFGERLTTVLDESVAVAETYLDEHKSNLGADAKAMAYDIERNMHLSTSNPQLFGNMLNSQVELRSLNEAVIIQQKRVIARSLLSFSFNFETVPDDMISLARAGEVVLTERDDRLFAVVAIEPLFETYLVISRLVDKDVLEHLERSEGAADEYRALKDNIAQFQIIFVIAFILLTLVLLFSVILYGMNFASWLATPITTVAQATERVRAGDYSIQIEEHSGSEEIDRLIHHFNRMTEQLNSGRLELIQANRMLDTRRRFSETVLRGVSAGVIALDTTLAIKLCNRPALKLLNKDHEHEITGQSLRTVMPEMTVFLSRVMQRPGETHQDQITIKDNEKTRTLQVKVSAEINEKYVEGFIVTLDDITPLISAQRSAAWADVARRVAHEIKNPLTPIKLSIDRLSKKFVPEDEKDAESFKRYIDMMSRHLKDIGTIVEEFASFARMPSAVFEQRMVKALLEKALLSAETANPHITYTLHAHQPQLQLLCDEGMMSQLFTNVLKNAGESINRSANKKCGAIHVEYHSDDALIYMSFSDNGVGFPEELIDKIMEPYVTTRSKGTGLGLAIVKKIIEEHKGTITIRNHYEDTGKEPKIAGAEIIITFPAHIELAKKNG